MGLFAIQFVIHTISIGRMLNDNGDNNRHMLKNVRFKQTLIFTPKYEHFQMFKMLAVFLISVWCVYLTC